MAERKPSRKLTDELRERLAEVVDPGQLDDVMAVLADYHVTRRPVVGVGGVGPINIVMSPPPPPGFSRWHLEEAFIEGRRRGRAGW